MTVTRALCWACGASDTKPWKQRNLGSALAAEDLRITDARYGTTLALLRCQACGFLFADDPDLGRLEELYGALEDPAYEDGDASRALQMRWLLDVCQEALPDAAALLDVGAATGLLVREASRRGIPAVGIEPSEALAETARRRGAHVLTGTLPHPALATRLFDLVTLVDVLEHVRNPVQLLQTAGERLSPRGVLVVVTPDVRSAAARMLGERWWHFRVAHVGYFSDDSFGRAAARAGLRVVGKKPARWFFPVGYLLERAERYVPVPIARILSTNRVGRRVLDVVLPLNLFDSAVYLLSSERAP